MGGGEAREVKEEMGVPGPKEKGGPKKDGWARRGGEKNGGGGRGQCPRCDHRPRRIRERGRGGHPHCCPHLKERGGVGEIPQQPQAP